jgi:hypothetical protein
MRDVNCSFCVIKLILFLYPPLPVVIDLPTLCKLYIPSEKLDHFTVSRKTTRSHRHILEPLGDSLILNTLRTVLTEIFGHRSSLAFLKLIEDHAKSNPLLAEIAKYYHLHHWWAFEPHSITQWANLLEAWIGAVVVSNSMWGDQNFHMNEESGFIL